MSMTLCLGGTTTSLSAGKWHRQSNPVQIVVQLGFYDIVIPSKRSLRREGSGRAAREPALSLPKGRVVCDTIFARLARIPIKLPYYQTALYCEASSSNPCSSFSWHSMQCRVHGTASSRLALISLPQ
jgi:hypothetical protein